MFHVRTHCNCIMNLHGAVITALHWNWINCIVSLEKKQEQEDEVSF